MLTKLVDPEAPNDLVFDYSSLEGSVSDTVMAIVAAERVFRMYRDPSVGDGDRVRVDKAVDRFLQAHFVQYQEMFGYREREFGEYVEYSHLKEDPQFDDITMMAIERK